MEYVHKYCKHHRQLVNQGYRWCEKGIDLSKVDCKDCTIAEWVEDRITITSASTTDVPDYVNVAIPNEVDEKKPAKRKRKKKSEKEDSHGEETTNI